MAIVKVIEPVPIKLIKGMWERMYFKRHWEVCLSMGSISEMLKRVGGDLGGQMEFFRALLRGKRYLLFDLSSVVSYSKNLRLAEEGYNSEVHWLKQKFASYALKEQMEERGIKFILPVRRNFEVIDYELQMEGSFINRKSGINWAKKEVQEGLYLLFEDVKLRVEGETTFIEMVSEGALDQSQSWTQVLS